MAASKVLIIRLSSIGDIVHCSGIPRHIKRRYEDAEVHWLVRSDNKELVEHNKYLARVISFDRQEGLGGWLKVCRRLRNENYTHVYDAHNNVRSHILSFFLRPKFFLRRSKHRFKRFLLFALKLNLFGSDIRAVDSYISPLRAWGIQNDMMGTELFLPPATFEKVRALIPASAKWVAMAPATAWPKKTWPLSYWKNLVGLTLSQTDLNVLVLGGPKDDFCKELVLDADRVLSLQGKLSLLESAAATSFCQTLVAADTGILHMAEGLQKDVVGIIGPTPFGTPARPGSIALQTQLWCKPCSKDGRGPCYNREYQKCLRVIEPTTVADSMKQIVERPK